MALNKIVQTNLPTEWGDFKISAYAPDQKEAMPHLALVHKDFDPSRTAVIRIHSECLTGDIFGSKRCDCGEQLQKSLQLIGKHKGVLLYLRQEGRGIGLINKLRTYNLQDEGLNTMDANTHLGFEVDARQYDAAINILADLNINRIKLITNNPDKINAFKESPVQVVERIPLVIPPGEENQGYLQVKKELMGHYLK